MLGAGALVIKADKQNIRFFLLWDSKSNGARILMEKEWEDFCNWLNQGFRERGLWKIIEKSWSWEDVDNIFLGNTKGLGKDASLEELTLLKGPYRHLCGNFHWELGGKGENIYDTPEVLEWKGGKFEEATRRLVGEMS